MLTLLTRSKKDTPAVAVATVLLLSEEIKLEDVERPFMQKSGFYTAV